LKTRGVYSQKAKTQQDGQDFKDVKGGVGYKKI
jgi:hypothetical protein